MFARLARFHKLQRARADRVRVIMCRSGLSFRTMTAISDNGEIKESMKLYLGMDRIFRELRAAGWDGMASLSVDQTAAFDSLHYLGDEATDSAIQRASINEKSCVLDVGAGYGGPARHLASKAGCRVLALELQEDLSQIGCDLTDRCQLSTLVEHKCGNILDDGSIDKESFSHVVSWLVYLHIDDLPRLFHQCYDALEDQGLMYVEDFFARGQFTEEERVLLAGEVSVPHGSLPTWPDMRQQLIDAGFEVIFEEDMTSRWTDFVVERHSAYVASRERNERVHGRDSYRSMLTFYDAIVKLFTGGNLGGIKYVVQKK